jgi:DNA-binding NarL/FixJ family response regulator
LSAEESAISGSSPIASTVGSVLTVDDQSAFRHLVRELVEATSQLVWVGEADSGEAAVRLVRELEPDLVLMDVRMPGLGGIDATREIKAIRPATVVALISTASPDELRGEAEECRADEIVSKGDLRPALLDEIWQRHQPIPDRGADRRGTPGRL